MKPLKKEILSLLVSHGYLKEDHRGTYRIDITYRSDYDLLDVEVSYFENDNTMRDSYTN